MKTITKAEARRCCDDEARADYHDALDAKKKAERQKVMAAHPLVIKVKAVKNTWGAPTCYVATAFCPFKKCMRWSIQLFPTNPKKIESI